jgi:hypothetical protein
MQLDLVQPKVPVIESMPISLAVMQQRFCPEAYPEPSKGNAHDADNPWRGEKKILGRIRFRQSGSLPRISLALVLNSDLGNRLVG